MNEIGIHQFDGDGDFRNPECIELLKQADIVVTNPPFSLFRAYVAQLMKCQKKFLIIGNTNAVCYKEIWPYIDRGDVWKGRNSGSRTFGVPDEYTKNTFIGDDGKKYTKLGNTCWYTNLDHQGRHEEIISTRKYKPNEYPKYDNYEGIEVDYVRNIPIDYEGVMGVPITFLDKHNPDQFEILGMAKRGIHCHLKTKTYTAKDAPNHSDLNAGAVVKTKDGYIPKYARLLIRRKGVDSGS